MVDDYAKESNSEKPNQPNQPNQPGQPNQNGPKHTNRPKSNVIKAGQPTLPSTGDVSEYLTVIGLISLMSGAFVTLRKRV